MATRKSPRRFTKEEDEFLRANSDGNSTYKLMEMFNERFSNPVTRMQIRNYTNRHGIKVGLYTTYTKDKREFIIDYYQKQKHTLAETVDAYNERFPDDMMTKVRMNGFLGFNKIKNGMQGRENHAQFKKGMIPYNILDDGVITTWGDEVMIKIDGEFVRLDRYVYEKANGVKLKSHELLYHLDRDVLNCDPDNLMALDRGESVSITRMKLTDDVETNRMIFAKAKLECAIRRRTARKEAE